MNPTVFVAGNYNSEMFKVELLSTSQSINPSILQYINVLINRFVNAGGLVTLNKCDQIDYKVSLFVNELPISQINAGDLLCAKNNNKFKLALSVLS